MIPHIQAWRGRAEVGQQPPNVRTSLRGTPHRVLAEQALYSMINKTSFERGVGVRERDTERDRGREIGSVNREQQENTLNVFISLEGALVFLSVSRCNVASLCLCGIWSTCVPPVNHTACMVSGPEVTWHWTRSQEREEAEGGLCLVEPVGL